MRKQTANLKNIVKEASSYTGCITVDANGYLKTTSVYRKVIWKDGRPWVRIANMGFAITGYINMKEYLGLPSKLADAYLFFVD
jgi:hypothetical protein